MMANSRTLAGAAAQRATTCSGNILLLTCCLAVITFFVGVVLLSLVSLLGLRTAMQTGTDQICTQTALILNRNDSLGRMNRLVLRCRERVFHMQSANAAAKNSPYETLSVHLLEKGRESARFLGEQQMLMAKSRLLAIRSLAQQSYPVPFMPCLQPEPMRITGIRLGYSGDENSGVNAALVCNQLAEQDRRLGYLTTNGLYKGDVELKLEGEDDLVFKLASLASSTTSTLKQAGLVSNNSIFKSSIEVDLGDGLKRNTNPHLLAPVVELRTTSNTGHCLLGSKNAALIHILSRASCSGTDAKNCY